MDDEKEKECQVILLKKNYYEILGVEKTAEEAQIKKAYRKLAIKFHPDKNKAKSAEEAFKKVNQAFCVLSDKNKRKNYDMFGTEEGPGISTFSEDFNPFDIFEQFFGDIGGMHAGGFHRGGGGTTFSFNNGGGTFTVFSSGFGNPFFQDDNDIDPFEEIFFGRSRSNMSQRSNRSNRTRSSNNQSNRKNNRETRDQMRRNIEQNMQNVTMCLQLFPLFCFVFIFIIFPWIIRSIFQ